MDRLVAPLDRSTLDELNRGASAARAGQRALAFDLFEKLDLPSGNEESWRYVDLDLDFGKFHLPDGAGPELSEGRFAALAATAVASARSVDGRVTYLEGSQFSTRDQDLPSAVPTDLDKFSAAFDAFSTDGISLRVPRGRDSNGLIVVEFQATQSGSASFPHLSIQLEPNSEASVVVINRSGEDVEALVVPRIEIEVGDGARLRLLSIQDLGLGVTSITHQRVGVGRDGSARLGEIGLGGHLGRLDLGVDLDGAGAGTEVVGIFFGHRRQTLDYRLVITHRGRNTTSQVFLKGAVEDEAESIFTGLLKIEKDAKHSTAFETNRNLVLSQGAKAHSVPNLEILCNEVMCGHGSSVGPLDEEHLYYLMSRGISRRRAERLLVRGFFREALDRLPISGAEGAVLELLIDRFALAQEGGLT
jgi:Fe-S cluster assembly protein SufD